MANRTKKELEFELQKMQEEKQMETKLSIIYQFVVLFAIIILNLIAFLKLGNFNDILLGALVGVCVGLAPSGIAIKNTNNKSEE